MSSSNIRAPLQVMTASWFTQLPPDIARIGVSRGPPRHQVGYRRLNALAPGPWHRTATEEEYITRYRAHLSKLQPDQTFERILHLAGGASRAALLCFEQPGSGRWCHRSLAAIWLTDALGIVVKEWGFEHLGSAEHPMLPPSLRK